MASLAIFLCPERVGIARVNAPGNKPSYNSPIWQDVEDMQQLLSEPAMLAAMVREKVGDENKYDLYISLYPGIYSEIVFSHDKRKKKELERLRQSELETVFHGEYASLYTYDLLLDKGKPSFNGKSRRIIFTVSKQWVNLLKEAFAAQKMKLVRLAPVDAVAAESALRYWAVADKGISLAMTLDEVCTSIAFMRGGNIMAMRTLPGGFGAVLNVYREVTGMTAEECRAMILTNGVHVAPDEPTYTTIQDEVLRTVNRLATEVVKMLHNTFGDEARLDNVLLCGNFSRTSGLKEYFDTVLEADCTIVGVDTISAATQQAICLNSGDLELMFPLAATASEGTDLFYEVKKAQKEKKQNVTLCTALAVVCAALMAVTPVNRFLLANQQAALQQQMTQPEYAAVQELYDQRDQLQRRKAVLAEAIANLPHGDSDAAGLLSELITLTDKYGTLAEMNVNYSTKEINLEFTTLNYDSFVYWQQAITQSGRFTFREPPAFAGNGLVYTVEAKLTATDFDAEGGN